MGRDDASRELYTRLEARLRKTKAPLTCVDLMSYPEIKAEALVDYGGETRDERIATNKLSDTLGYMWRRGVLTRYPAPKVKGPSARFAYAWAAEPEHANKPLLPPVRLTGKQAIAVTETNDGVEIEFEKFIVAIRVKS